MKTLALPGFWYCDTTPEGRYVAAPFGQGGAVTDRSLLLGPELQWVRIAPDGVRFAGTGANDGDAWEWDGSAWQNRGPFVAPRAVIYRADGSLHVERDAAWPGSGSQGWRYVDDSGVLIPGWATYADPSRQIYEYTERGGVTIGQGNGGVEALIPGKRIRLDRLFPDLGDAPACFAVNFNKDGHDYAISWYVAHSSVNYTACFVWLTDAELRALPDATVSPTPVPIPVPIPPPTPEPTPMQMPIAAWRVVEQMHARFAEGLPRTEDGARRFTEMTLEQLSFSFPEGGWCWKKASEGRPPSKDCTARQIDGRFEGWDILSGAGANGPRVLAAYPPTYHDLKAEGNQVPIPVGRKNHLGVTPEPEPEPDPEPEPHPPTGDQPAWAKRLEDKLDRLLSVYRV